LRARRERKKTLRRALPRAGRGVLTPLPPAEPSTNADKQPAGPAATSKSPAAPKPPVPAVKPKPPAVPSTLRGFPVISGQPAPVKKAPKAQKPKAQKPAPKHIDDNSNSQFAILALWAARRYDVPLDRTMALVEHRYRTSQFPDGRWSYRHDGSPPPPSASMTCVGLLGLAIAHGVAHEFSAGEMTAKKDPKQDGLKRPPLKDQAIEKGLTALARAIGFPAKVMPKKIAQGNLYMLWSVERVAVLYNLHKIG